MAADLDFDGKSPYEVLGLVKGPESTADEIKKVNARAGGDRAPTGECAQQQLRACRFAAFVARALRCRPCMLRRCAAWDSSRSQI
jgi:hypothetical protein